MSKDAAARALIGLGSNLDDPPQQVRRALAALANLPHTRLLRHSRLYRTTPWGVAEQPTFVNAVAEVATSLAPHELLRALLTIERLQGRLREGSRWGPRTLDLDLLLYADVHLSEPGLTLPHPRMAERAFVLAPLAELDENIAIAGVGTVRDLLSRLDARDCVPLDVAEAPADQGNTVEPSLRVQPAAPPLEVDRLRGK